MRQKTAREERLRARHNESLVVRDSWVVPPRWRKAGFTEQLGPPPLYQMSAAVDPIKAPVAARKIFEVALERGREYTPGLTESGGGLAPRVADDG